jgi:hypothetical protein
MNTKAIFLVLPFHPFSYVVITAAEKIALLIVLMFVFQGYYSLFPTNSQMLPI